MGQYYRAVNLDKEEWLSPYDYDCGAKLTEHSWIKNPFVQMVEILLTEGQPWHKTRLVWAGDYMDNGLFLDFLSEKESKEINLYSYSKQNFSLQTLFKNKIKIEDDYCYIVNHTLGFFVDKNRCPSNYGWIVHPLPILTCSGNGRGGGDYYNENGSDHVGSWAGHIISIEKTLPASFIEIIPNFKEDED